ncbi:MAG: hypothetical protein ACJ735_02565 [Actinomycetes bacterium]
MGKRARRRAREQRTRGPDERASLAAVLAQTAWPDALASLEELHSLVQARAALDIRIHAVVDELATKGTSWARVALVLGVSRQAARQAYLRRHPQRR